MWSKTQEIKNMRYRKAKCIQTGIKGRCEGKKMYLYLLKKKKRGCKGPLQKKLVNFKSKRFTIYWLLKAM